MAQYTGQPFAAKCLALRVEAFDRHSLEEMGEDPLLGFPVGVEPDFHRHKNRREKCESRNEAANAAAETDKCRKCVSHRQGTVEVERRYRTHCL